MGDATDAGHDTVDVALAVGGELIGGGKTFATTAFAEGDETRIDDSADEGNTVVGGLAEALLGMEREVEMLFEEMVDDVDIAKELSTLRGGDDNEEIIHIATIMMITELVGDETVKLVEEDVGEELTGKVADDDAAAFGLVEEAFSIGKVVPVGAEPADDNIAHGVVVDDLVPEKLEGEIELLAVVGMAVDVILGVFGVGELAL